MGARETALRLITKKGRSDGVLRRPGQDAAVINGRPWAPTDADPGVMPIVLSGFPVVVIGREMLKDKDAQALAAEATAVAMVPELALNGATVQVGDVLEAGAARYAVLRVSSIDEGSSPVIHTLDLKAR